MVKMNHHPEAAMLISVYMDALPPFFEASCIKLKAVIYAAIPLL